MNLYGHTDPELARALQAGLDADRMANRQGMDALKPGGDVAMQMKKAALGAARLMNADDGPRIGALAIDGWDTHAAEGGATGRLAQLAGRARRRFRRLRKRTRPALEGYGRRRDHRIRPHRAHQRHRRHRPRHRHGRLPRRRRARGRTRRRRLAGPQERPISTRRATSSRRRICAPCSRACSPSISGSPPPCWRARSFPTRSASSR